MTAEELIEILTYLPADTQITIAVGGEMTDSFQAEYNEVKEVLDLYTT